MTVYLAEAIGTMILLILGNGVVANVLLNRTKGQNSGWIVITTGWGLAVALAVYSVGRISGAHINPAVTFGLALHRSLFLVSGAGIPFSPDDRGCTGSCDCLPGLFSPLG